jgi:hypothetical protein
VNEFPSKSAFEAALNSNFELSRDGMPTLNLTMYQLETKLATPQQECFTMLFLAPSEAPAIQDIYWLTHPTLGRHGIFLVPVRKDAAGLHFEAVFNRLLN